LIPGRQVPAHDPDHELCCLAHAAWTRTGDPKEHDTVPSAGDWATGYRIDDDW
jgi:hypothetical protein